MEMQGLVEKNTNNSGSSAQPHKKIIIIVAIAAVVLIIIASFMTYNHNKKIDYAVAQVVEELLDCVDYRPYRITYPVMTDYIWKPGGYYNEVKDNKKLVEAINNALTDICTKKETEEFYANGIGRVYRIAAVLEYLDYENAQVKDCIDSLTALALEEVHNGGSYSTDKNVYVNLMPFDSLTYYTGRKEMLKNEEIEDYYNNRWQEVKQAMAEHKDELADFIEDVEYIASVAPVEIPEPIQEKTSSGEYATAVNAVPIKQMYLDIDKMMPYDELLAALQANGEPAVFRNGQGGYYDANSIKGTTYGDFALQVVSGRARRTGKEDAFTEQYLREHYDRPSKTYCYFRGEEIGAFPPFFNDTKYVFVYDNEAYALTDYAVYFEDIMLPYDYEAANEAEFKHITASEEDMLNSSVHYSVEPYLKGILSDFQPTYQIDIENRLVTVYITALPGTTAALQSGERIPFNKQGDRFVEWKDLLDLLCDISDDMYYDLTNNFFDKLGVALIMRSDVNAEAGLLSILNGEVVQDNSDNPPAPSTGEETPENSEQTPEN